MRAYRPSMLPPEPDSEVFRHTERIKRARVMIYASRAAAGRPLFEENYQQPASVQLAAKAG